MRRPLCLSLALCLTTQSVYGQTPPAADGAPHIASNQARAGADAAVAHETATESAPNSYTSRSTQMVPPHAGKRAWTHDGSWGWFLVASSLFVGAGLTGFGLGQTCDGPDGKHSACTRWTSMAIWGGIGFAAVGSILGLIVVQRGRARVMKQNFATVNLGPLGDVQLVPPLTMGNVETR